MPEVHGQQTFSRDSADPTSPTGTLAHRIGRGRLLPMRHAGHPRWVTDADRRRARPAPRRCSISHRAARPGPNCSTYRSQPVARPKLCCSPDSPDSVIRRTRVASIRRSQSSSTSGPSRPRRAARRDGGAVPTSRGSSGSMRAADRRRRCRRRERRAHADRPTSVDSSQRCPAPRAGPRRRARDGGCRRLRRAGPDRSSPPSPRRRACRPGGGSRCGPCAARGPGCPGGASGSAPAARSGRGLRGPRPPPDS